ncbi:hypothetical protein ACFL19_02405, partial [Pseudomonadota bacterium]
DNRYGTEHILGAVNFLRNSGAPSYNFETLLRAISGQDGSEHGGWEATDWLKDKEILIIGSGPGGKRHMAALQQYINRSKPVVFCLNINDSVPSEIVTAYVACHETRILIEADHYSSLKKPLLMPICRVPDALLNGLESVEILDYGLRIQKGTFMVGSHGCVLSSPLAIAYAMAIVKEAGGKRILLAGFDGYGEGDPRQLEMIEVLEQYQKMDHAAPLEAVTPTTYPIRKRSIYEPDL